MTHHCESPPPLSQARHTDRSEAQQRDHRDSFCTVNVVAARKGAPCPHFACVASASCVAAWLPCSIAYCGVHHFSPKLGMSAPKHSKQTSGDCVCTVVASVAVMMSHCRIVDYRATTSGPSSTYCPFQGTKRQDDYWLR